MEIPTDNRMPKMSETTSRLLAGKDGLGEKMSIVLRYCQANKWSKVFSIVQEDPALGLMPVLMKNFINTSIIHQAITSKGDTFQRARVIRQILRQTPQAAGMTNGFGSLPLHVIAQRNTKMKAQVKEDLMYELVKAYPDGLTLAGGKGKRTPLHVLFTDYVNLHIVKMMVSSGKKACFMKDAKGYLPIHVACSRHCSPKKLEVLLKANPDSLFETTYDGNTCLSLAMSTATKSHPNMTLVNEIKKLMSLKIGKAATEEMQKRVPPVTPESMTFKSAVKPRGTLRRPVALSFPLMQKTHSVSFPSLGGRLEMILEDSPSRSEKSTTAASVSQAPAGKEDVNLLLHFSRTGSSPTNEDVHGETDIKHASV